MEKQQKKIGFLLIPGVKWCKIKMVAIVHPIQIFFHIHVKGWHQKRVKNGKNLLTVGVQTVIMDLLKH